MSPSYDVTEAKRRFSELVDRAAMGEAIEIRRRGRPVAVLVPASFEESERARTAPVGLAAVAGALSDWDELEETVNELHRARSSASDWPAPALG